MRCLGCCAVQVTVTRILLDSGKREEAYAALQRVYKEGLRVLGPEHETVKAAEDGIHAIDNNLV